MPLELTVTAYILVLQLEWRLEHAIPEEIRKETTKNCNSRVELGFPVMLNVTENGPIFHVWRGKLRASWIDKRRKVSQVCRHSERQRVHLVVSLARIQQCLIPLLS